MRAILGIAGNGALSAQDAALLREAEELMPEGPLSGPLVGTDGRPVGREWEAWTSPGRAPPGPLGPGASPAGKAGPTARRVAEAVTQELRRYFEQHPAGRAPTARSVIGGRLAKWAQGMRASEASLEEVRWWCDFLRHIEDARVFTRSNWARSSEFEEALSHCRLLLLDLRSQLGSTGVVSELRSLREALEAVHASGRAAADRLLELLFVGLRPRPVSDRAAFHEILRRAMQALDADGGDLGESEGEEEEDQPAYEDQLCYQILQLEQSQMTDLLAPLLLRGGAGGAGAEPARCRPADSEESEEEGEDGGAAAWVKMPSTAPEVLEAAATFASASEALAEGDGQPWTRIPPHLVKAVGPGPVAAFWELHGLYCLLAALLQRLELSLQAVREYAQFVCFLPVYRATVVDMEAILPELWRRIGSEVGALSKAYEGLPRAAVPASRRAVLEKCRELAEQVGHCGVASMAALMALRACTPQSTLNDFEGWQSGDRRWLQVARLQVAAQALLPPQDLVTLNIPELAAHLRLGGHGLPGQLRILDSGPKTATERSKRPQLGASTREPLPLAVAESLSQMVQSGLGALVDEDTRLHTLVLDAGTIGRRLNSQLRTGADKFCAAAAPVGARASQEVAVKLERLLAAHGHKVPADLPEHALGTVAEQVSRLACLFVGPGAPAVDLCDGDWVMLERAEDRTGGPEAAAGGLASGAEDSDSDSDLS